MSNTTNDLLVLLIEIVLDTHSYVDLDKYRKALEVIQKRRIGID